MGRGRGSGRSSHGELVTALDPAAGSLAAARRRCRVRPGADCDPLDAALRDLRGATRTAREQDPGLDALGLGLSGAHRSASDLMRGAADGLRVGGPWEPGVAAGTERLPPCRSRPDRRCGGPVPEGDPAPCRDQSAILSVVAGIVLDLDAAWGKSVTVLTVVQGGLCGRRAAVDLVQPVVRAGLGLASTVVGVARRRRVGPGAPRRSQDASGSDAGQVRGLFPGPAGAGDADAVRRAGRPVTGTAVAELSAVDSTRMAMTWTVTVQESLGVVLVGKDARTDPRQGDTPVTQSLPLLCFRSVPGEIQPPAGVNLTYTPGVAMPSPYYSGWSRGWVALTPAIRGTSLASLNVANATCVRYFGDGWRIAEFHDGWWYYDGAWRSRGGWRYWAHGVVPADVRFWVRVDDQPANPWGL